MVGIINLKWHKACAVRGMGFTKDEQAAGWPESFALERLAILQSPGDKKMANILHRALKDACAASLPSAPTIVRKIGHETKTYLETGSFVRRNLDGERERVYRERIVPVMKDVKVPAVTAADFAAWLAAQGEKPSEHIAAWFDAVGVDMDTRPIAPPTGWQARTEHGLLRFDDTDAGRLVRLADLVTWLMDSRELPCKPAVEMVCTALESNPSAAASLYLLTESGYAKPLPASHTFYSEPLVSFWDAQPQGDDTDKGVVGAVKYMRDYWGESPAPGASKRMGKEVLDPLCTRLDVAFRLWGYGHRVDEVQPDDAPTVALASQMPLPAPAVVIEPTRESPAKLKRRNLLTPVIERAQRECSAPFEASAVFPVLMRMAEASEKPFIGATDDGIKWKNHNDEIQFLSLKNLRDRLRRQEKRAAQPQKTPLKRVK